MNGASNDGEKTANSKKDIFLTYELIIFSINFSLKGLKYFTLSNFLKKIELLIS